MTRMDRPAAPPQVIAHRGASGYETEHTFAAFDLALAQGADVLELDVRVTADGVPIVMHDPTLDRTTDMSAPVAERAFEQLRRADAGARFTADGGATFPWRGRGGGGRRRHGSEEGSAKRSATARSDDDQSRVRTRGA